MFCEVDTTAGKICGLDHGPVLSFKGVPYGASTSGPNRFKPPRRPEPWAGIRECIGYGQAAPQGAVDPRYQFANLLQFNVAANIGGMGEDCLNLNLWTPGLGSQSKRAVLVCFHGGAFANGSSNLPLYDGAALAIRGDVVVLSVNHRLNAFGFLGLSGDGFEKSGNVGLLDLIASLEWVRDNVAQFGGDPDQVTLIGQSGGGWKISCLLSMPRARGLFARAVIQSGSLNQIRTQEANAPVTRSLLDSLGVSEPLQLQSIPWRPLLEAIVRVGLHAFEPVVDGTLIPHARLDPAEDIPLIISSTLDDASFLSVNFAMTDAELKTQLETRYGDSAARILDLYRAHWPHKSAHLLSGQIMTDAGFRRFAHVQTERRVSKEGAPVYAYQWSWVSPVFDGVYGASHALDVPASFFNLHDPMLAGVSVGQQLAGTLSDALARFARTGDAGWKAFDIEARSTMVFDAESKITDDPNTAIRQFWSTMPMAGTVFG